MSRGFHHSVAIALLVCSVIGSGRPAFAAAETVAQSGGAPPAPPQDPNGALAAGAVTEATGSAVTQATSPLGAGVAPLPQAPPAVTSRREPRREEIDPRKRRFFRTPAGVMLLVVAGALAAGAATQIALDAGRSR